LRDFHAVSVISKNRGFFSRINIQHSGGELGLHLNIQHSGGEMMPSTGAFNP